MEQEQWKPIQEFNGEYEVSNLEWCTYQANMQHAVRTGLTHPHQWTDEERKQISDKVKAYRRRANLTPGV